MYLVLGTLILHKNNIGNGIKNFFSSCEFCKDTLTEYRVMDEKHEFQGKLEIKWQIIDRFGGIVNGNVKQITNTNYFPMI